MNLTELFIRRPVLSTMVMVAMIVFGLMGYVNLPVSDLPQVQYPTIAVTAELPGADPETVATSIATPLERRFSSIDGLRSMSSASSFGSATITLQFDLSRDIDAASTDVQAAISRTGGDLPANMPSPPMFKKVNPSEQPIYYLVMTSDAMPLYKVSNYARSFVIDALSTVPGVAEVQDLSQQKFTVRVRVNPEVLAARGIGIEEVAAAVNAHNVDLPTGTLDGRRRSRTVKTSGQLKEARAYESVIVSYIDGQPIRLSRLGQAENSVINDRITVRFNGKECIALAVKRRPGSNTVEIVDEIERRLPGIRAQIPAAVKLESVYDMSKSIRKSIDDVKTTLVLAVALVVAVVFLFLRSISGTLVASIAVPLSIVSTFAFMYLFGFSLDNLSLMALVLAVGFVVDDAVVVLENVARHMQMGKKPFQAAIDGAREIVFTIVSMTTSLAVVFVPIMFMSGIYGRVLNEFAVTITIAILVSGVVSICVSPMISSRLLRPSAALSESSSSRHSVVNAYSRSVRLAVRFRAVTLVVAAAMLAGTVYLFVKIPKDFIPSVDMGYLYGVSITEQGISPKSLAERIDEVSDRVLPNPGVRSVLSVSGYPQSNQGLVLPILKDRPPRTADAHTVKRRLMAPANSVPGALTFFQVPPLIQTGTQSTASPYQLVLKSGDTETLYREARKFTRAMHGIHQITGVHSNLYMENPETLVDIDRERAATLGVTPEQIETALFSAYGERQLADIYGADDTYKVVLQVEEADQRYVDQLERLYVRGGDGRLVRMDTLATVRSRLGPVTVNHSDQLPSVTVSFDTAPGNSLGAAVQAVKSLAKKTLPASVGYHFEGTAKAFQRSVKSLVMLLVVAVIVIYMILAVLYEGFLIPLTILSGLPSAAFGGLLVLWWFDRPLDLFGYVGLFMLVGIVKKNAIMVVDFAREAETAQGMSPREAAVNGSVIRFRPIMMTTLAAIAGMMPIAIGYGAGGETRQPLGLTVVGGLLISQVVTLYLTPAVYSYLASLEEWIGGLGKASKEMRGIPTRASR